MRPNDHITRRRRRSGRTGEGSVALRALLWNFTVLGEAASQLDDQVKTRFPQGDWSRPIRVRNRIVHGYWSADLSVLHATAADDLPAFASRLRGILAEVEAADQEPP